MNSKQFPEANVALREKPVHKTDELGLRKISEMNQIQLHYTSTVDFLVKANLHPYSFILVDSRQK